MQFENGVLSTREGKAYALDRLVKGLTEEPGHSSYSGNVTDRVLAILDKAETDLPGGQRLEFRRAWDGNVQRLWWPAVNLRCFELWKYALEHQRRRDGSTQTWAVEFLRALPAATKADEWFEWCFNEFLKRLAIPDGFLFGRAQDWVDCLQEFQCWTGLTVRQLFHAVEQSKESLTLDRIFNLVRPATELSSRDRACFALTFLMRERNRLSELGSKLERDHIQKFKEQKQHVGNLPEGQTLLRIYARLDDLPSRRYDDKSVWLEFGPDERAAWRADIVNIAGEQATIRQGLIEHILWQTQNDRYSNDLYSDMEPLVLSLCRTDEDVQFVGRLRDEHVSRLVSVRAAALIARIGRASAPSPFVYLPEDGITTTAASHALAISVGNELHSRTWMQDPTMDRIVFGAVTRIENEFCDGYQHDWRLDEEVHLATLLTRLQGAFKDANGLFNALSTLGRARRASISHIGRFRNVKKALAGSAPVASQPMWFSLHA